jgi:O-antigen ligase
VSARRPEPAKALSAPVGSLSDPELVRAARRLRLVCQVQELGLMAIVAGSVAALASVRPAAYVPLWIASGVLALLLAERAAAVGVLRRRLGARRFSFHQSGLWLVLDEESPYGIPSWSFDLSRPAVPLAPLVGLGLVFLAWVALQLAPLPAGVLDLLNPRRAELVRVRTEAFGALSVSVLDTRRGLAFLACALLVHLVAGAVFDRAAAARRFRRFLAVLGLVLGFLALAQRASGTHRLYGVIDPLEYDGSVTAMGPFVNRNHFAGYMLLIAPIVAGLFARRLDAYRRRSGGRTNLRRWLVGLESRLGGELVFTGTALLVCGAALLASGSRGGVAALGVSLLAVLVCSAARGGSRVAVTLALLAGVTVVLAGRAGLLERWGHLSRDAPGRLIVWRAALSGMPGLWLTGSGFNTFSSAVSRTTAWALPKGATPWQEPEETSVTQNPRMGYFAMPQAHGLGWYREAHNDYVQLLVETGLPGLLIALLAAAGLLWRVRDDPFLTAALLGLLLHEIVDFDLQNPAVAVLFASAAALPPRRASRTADEGAREPSLDRATAA